MAEKKVVNLTNRARCKFVKLLHAYACIRDVCRHFLKFSQEHLAISVMVLHLLVLKQVMYFKVNWSIKNQQTGLKIEMFELIWMASASGVLLCGLLGLILYSCIIWPLCRWKSHLANKDIQQTIQVQSIMNWKKKDHKIFWKEDTRCEQQT